MQAYRFYFLGRDGAVAGYEEIDCANDDAAVNKAAELRPASAPEYTMIEIWQGSRLVHRREQLVRSDEGKAP